ncbi:MAG: amidohydrolase family protein [Acidimicrobiales bacterium]|jgi:cytosine/adenosine deaminase-related metal-dependent hydrolase|nr:amidohydrolase family protein [Acidimicrobiales bacterium]HJM29171.1 amidohydrolase family protein [Acidimicrobiales bacterium]
MTIINADWLITSAEQLPRQSSGVRVMGNKVVDVASNKELQKNYPEDDVIDASENILLPGFVNAHTHLYGVLAHGIPLDNPPEGFWEFLKDYWWPKIEDSLDQEMIAVATKWACVEMLQSGTTTFYDILEAPNSLPGGLLIQRDVIKETGLRGILSFEATERSGERIAQMGIEENLVLHEATKEDDLISAMMCLHTTFTCSKEFISQAFQKAEESGLGFHVHCNEGTHEGVWCEENHSKRPLELYEDLGVTNTKFIASQCVHLSEKEKEILERNEIKVTHMPLANCEVGGGIAPIPELLDQGITIGLGSDGYINDFYEVMRGAFLVHKARLRDPGVMSAQNVLEMATFGGAKALGLTNVGKLNEGFSADLQIIDAKFPTPVTAENIVEQVILWRNSAHVKDVMVAGKWLVRDKQVLDIDKEAVRTALHEQAKRLWAK